MRGHSNALDAAVQTSGTTVIRANLLRDGKVVRPLDVHGFTVTSDGTAAQRTTIQLDVTVPEGDDLVPVDMTSFLAPNGDRIQVDMGARIQDETLLVQVNGVYQGWAVSNTSTGILNGLKDDGTGLVLGP
jgi:hypothetical protein